ncbi:glycosyl transferase family 2 [Thermodesulfobacterium geofontis OPF15]|jgi:GT2 family glycosyltransferase|uniref:Glycosyl transferase family 2 n=1 Tax=Thermodesulfobacterium geofontis (strain OPF15) TaxID=795359 RepID=F8C3K4_THEGP|nr:glycosyltransferase family 2 protein [Thermodesulfobacterium geofontis]AEH22453.1 glycosyl transferase family 2 [Thermodesulfobacterium geofontis OPF15]
MYQVIVVDNNSPNNFIGYLKAWAKGKLDVWVNSNNPLRNLSFPPVPKPIPYIYYTREEAKKGGSPELEEELKNKMPKDITSKYPMVFIQSGGNLGFAGGNNVGIRYALAKNDFDGVILLNNDTVIKRDTISNLVNARLEFGEQAIYGGRIYYYSDPDRIWYDGGRFNEWIGRTTHLNMRKLKTEVKNNQAIKEVNFITFCYVLIPKFILDKIGLLDKSYFMYAEDLDYSYKVWKSGYKLYHVVNSEIWHKVGASSGEEEISEFSAYRMMRSRVRFIISRLPYAQKIASIYFLIITRPIRFLFFYIRRAKYIINAQIKGLMDGFKKLK